MKDAMIINKHSYERGFGHGVVYKSKILDAAPRSASKEEQETFARFGRNPNRWLHVGS